jgi:protein-S-isoprenylcysteine O-methyltransferase Ste14
MAVWILRPVGTGEPAAPAPAAPGAERAGAGALRIALATILFGFAHSALAGSAAKTGAAALFGERAANGLYRPVYLVVTTLLVAWLVGYARRQPGRELYHVRGPVAWLMRGGQGLALAFAGWAVFHVGLDFMTGWDALRAWWDGAAQVPRMHDGQGPAPAGATMLASGPFAYTRHPLNWFLVPLLWLNPRMTTRLLAFNLVASAYAVVGSLHVESHLLDAYGAGYRWYQERVPFFWGPR